MKVLKPLAVVSVLATTAFAQQDRGLFISAGGGYAKLSVDDFTQVTTYGETLRTTDGDDTVGFVRGELGYRFSTRWDLALGYTDYGTGEVQVSYPGYPNILSILPMPAYSKNVMKYDATRIALIPSYRFALGEKISLRVRAGVTYDETKAHFETTYYQVFSGPPPGTFSRSFSEEKNESWNYLLSLGAEYAITQNLSIGITATYAPFELKVASEQIAGVGNGATRPSPEVVDVNALEGAIVLTWRL